MERVLRYVHNRFPDYEQGVKGGETIATVQERVRGILRAKTELLRQRNPPTTSMEIGTSQDRTKPAFRVYTASGGNVVVYGKLGIEQSNSNTADLEASNNALTALRVSLRLAQNQPSRSCSFYMGAAGIYSLAAVLDAANWRTYANSLAGEWVPEKSEDDEVLFGKAGFLYSLLYVQKNNAEAGEQLRGLVEEVAENLIERGLRVDRTLLVFPWRGRDYLGAAHGLVGILQVLILCFQLNEAWLFREKNTFNDYRQLLEHTVDYLCDLQYPSGNFPSHIADAGKPEKDKLVHFCHGRDYAGAPGAIMTLCTAYNYFRNQRFLNTAMRAGDMIWERGLLKKGNGLCHGISGNGYSFLALYRYLLHSTTRQEKWLWRALKFAEATDTQWVQEEVARWVDPQRDAVGVPDTPYSLMEGLGGNVCFLVDVLQPEASRFPGYEL